MEMGSEGMEGPEIDDSQLFLVRVWLGEKGQPDGHEQNELAEDKALHGEVRGKVQHVLSGSARSFSDCSSLMDVLYRLMPPMCRAEARSDKADEVGLSKKGESNED
jgi:hypothetical protein